jgi:hypothetical protein
VITVACFSIAVVNVLLRRESAYLIEERIKVIVESRKSLMDPILDKIQVASIQPIPPLSRSLLNI